MIKKSILLTSLAHLSKMVMAFVLLKLVAVYLGARGMGQLGHLMSVVSIAFMLAGGGTVNAVIKYSAEYRNNLRRLLRFMSVSATYSFSICAFVFVFCVVFSTYLSELIFGRAEFYWVVIVLGLAQFFYAFVNQAIGVSSGTGNIKKLAIIQSVGAIIAIPVAWFLMTFNSIAAAGVAIILAFCMSAIPGGWAYKSSVFRGRIKLVVLKREELKILSQYSLMIVVSALAFPIVEILIRQDLINKVGYYEAGLWQALVRGTGAYLGFFSVFLAYYFVPRVVETKSPAELSALVKKMVVFVSASFFLGAALIYFGREFFLSLLLSDDFISLSDHLFYQLVGDFFRAISWVIAFVAVAKAKTKIYLIGEFLQSAIFVGLVWIGLGQSIVGIERVVVAYAITYIFYFLICGIYFFIYLNAADPELRSNN